MSDPKKPGPTASTVEPEAPARIRNPGPNPRSYWTEEFEVVPRDGLFAPGECRDITAAQAAAVRRAIDKGHLTTSGGTNRRTGEKFPASVEFTTDPVITAEQLLKIAQAKLDGATAA